MVNSYVDMQKRKKPVYEACEMTFEDLLDGAARIEYQCNVPWYLRCDAMIADAVLRSVQHLLSDSSSYNSI